MDINPIESVAARLQRLAPEVRWIHAQQDVIVAEAFKSRVHLGPWGTSADRLIAVADWLGLGGIFVALANFVLLLGVFFAQRRAATKNFEGLLFVGMGALREPLLIDEVAKRFSQRVSVTNEMDIRSFFCFRKVGMSMLVREWLSVWTEIRANLKASHAQGLSRRHCLIYLLRVGHKYIYARAWFRNHLREQNNFPIAFSAAGWPAFAAISIGADTIYLPHGFQAHSIVYPDFREACFFDRYEADHIRKRLPNIRVTVSAPPVELVQTERLAAIAGDYGGESDDALAQSFLDWAKQVNLRVIVRPHPRRFSNYWQQCSRSGAVEIVNDDCDFTSFLRKYRPRVLVSLYSTTLFDALLHGIVPITLIQDDQVAALTVFPFQKIALKWPDQKSVVQSIIDSPEACAALVSKTYADMIGA
jgi:hypothetical protein